MGVRCEALSILSLLAAIEVRREFYRGRRQWRRRAIGQKYRQAAVGGSGWQEEAAGQGWSGSDGVCRRVPVCARVPRCGRNRRIRRRGE